MMSVFTYYGKNEIVKDIINYCVSNPENLDFGDKLNITYRKLEYGFAYVSILVNYKDFSRLHDFKLVAELIKEV